MIRNEKIWMVIIVALMTSCSAGKHYFNKRIDAPGEKISFAQPGTLKETQFLMTPLVNDEGMIEACNISVPPRVFAVPEKVSTGKINDKAQPVVAKKSSSLVRVALVLTAPVRLAEAAMKKMEQRLQRIETAGSATKSSDDAGIVLMVLIVIFLLTFFISLGLGYTVAQSVLYGLSILLTILGGCCCC